MYGLLLGFAFLLAQQANAQGYNPQTYWFKVNGPVVTTEGGYLITNDTVIISCHYDPFEDVWSSSLAYKRLQAAHVHVQLIGPNGQPVSPVHYNQTLTAYIDPDPNTWDITSDGCEETYRWCWHLEINHPNFHSTTTGPMPINIYQYVHILRGAEIPEDAGGYLPPVIFPATPGLDIKEKLASYGLNENTDIADYVFLHGGISPDINGPDLESNECWDGYTAQMSEPLEVDNHPDDGNCYRSYDVVLSFEDLGCVTNHGNYFYHQLFHIPAPSSYFARNVNGLDNYWMDTLEVAGCGISDVPPPCESGRDFKTYGVEFVDLLYIDSLKVLRVTDGQTEIVNEQYLGFQRDYLIDDPCSGVPKNLHQYIKIVPSLKVTRHQLRPVYYGEDGVLPPVLTNIRELVEHGLLYQCTCPNPTVTYLGPPDEVTGHGAFGKETYKRKYEIRSDEYEWLRDTVYEMVRFRVDSPEPFTVEVDNALCDNQGLGKATIIDANTDEGCMSCGENNKTWYWVVWQNNTFPERSDTVDIRKNPEADIWAHDSLWPGDYTLKLFSHEDAFADEEKPFWGHDFTLEKPKDEDVTLKEISTVWSAFQELNADTANHVVSWGTNRMVVFVDEVCGYDQGPDDEWDDTRTNPNKRMSYRWLGKGASPGYWGRPKDFGILVGMTEYEYWNLRPQMSYFWSQDFIDRMGHKMFDGRLWEYYLSKGRNDLRIEVTYKVGNTKTTQHSDFQIYFKNICTSNDPNEIYGPEGYDTVHFINTTDPITYTIMFENDPEFATAPASRVEVTCPLDDKGELNSFCLGAFGFGDQTYEVPTASAHYSNRIDLTESHGVWLDVVAGVKVPENYAYWIFQSIDPATGLQPSGSIGFLPINDTINPGNGEGYVTFTINPRANLVTGDEIVEQADILFDQNDTVPTNVYSNRFDAVAPVSSLSCDTTDALNNGFLPFSFTASDDEEGSGVSLVNLYVNIDGTGYQQVGTSHPDSVYRYEIGAGNYFEFMGCAVDNVNNKEEFKPEPEFTFIRGTAPTDINLVGNTFNEDASLFTVIGNFNTTDDQTSNVFVYTLVDGDGADHNDLFTIIGDALVTNNDFRCYGLYDYSIRVRSLDLSDQYIEKVFSVSALQNMTPESTTQHDYLCPQQSYYFAGEYLTHGGIYYDTLETVLGCDSIVCLVLDEAAESVLTQVDGAICFGEDYSDNGFNLSVDTLTQLTAGWTMEDDIVLTLDRYTENYYGCYDTTRLSLTLHPAFYHADVVSVCATELPYVYREMSFYNDTVALFSYPASTACDSTYALQLTVRPEETQTEDFAYGWNWFSLYIDQSNGQGLANLENALSNNAIMIKSRTQFTNYDPGTGLWFGNLLEMDNKSMYMVKMNNPNVVSQSGCSADVDTITLRQGWNWIGYPMTDTTYVNQLTNAIGGGPANYDLIKSKTAFSIYDADYGFWYGSLNVLTSGVGYMYKSNSSNQKPLYYPNRSRQAYQPLDIPVVHWVPDHAQFFSNMTLTGVIWLDGQRVDSDTLEVGAFVNGEQRGSGRAVYIEQLDAYRVFLLIHGEEGDVVNFRLFNHNREKERRIRCNDLLTFHADNNYGTLDMPYAIDFLTDYDTYIQAEICEGEYYMDNGFRVNQAGTYFQEVTTSIGNDSIIRLDLAVNPVYHVEEDVVAVEFPFVYQGLTFSSPGTYMLDFNTAAACDSVWVVNVIPYEGQRELLISPLPATRTQRVSLYYPFTQQEQQDVVVEVYTLTGSLVQSCKPTRFPIELDPFTTSGTYMLKITMGTGEVLSGKIIVR